MTGPVRIKRTAERPAIRLWLTDSSGALIDFSTGYTFTFKVGFKGSAALVTQSTGIAGAAGAGVEPSGTPNVVITPTAGEFDSIAKGTNYVGQLTATTGGLDRIFQFPVVVDDVIT